MIGATASCFPSVERGSAPPMQPIDRDEVRRLTAEEDAQLVEVLPAKEYGEEHLPGSVSIPLRQLGEDAVRSLDPSRPVIVYCYDYQ